MTLKCDLSYDSFLENSVLSMAWQSETSLLRTVRDLFLLNARYTSHAFQDTNAKNRGLA